MDVVDAIKRYGADKIAFLGLFAVALLLARFIVVSRSAIILSGPIELKYAGLSVSMPTENGWRSEKQWKYYESAFTLSSFFDAGSGRTTAMARCRYILLPTTASADALFEEKASAIGGVLANRGQIPIDISGSSFAESLQDTGPLLINWVYIENTKELFDIFFGIAKLPNGHRLDIEVYQEGDDADRAEQVFRRVTESVKLKDNQALDAGCETVAAIKSKGLGSFLGSPPAGETQDGGNFYLMKDARGRSIGFAMDVVISAPILQQNRESELYDVGEGAQSIQAASFYYIRDPYNREQATFFQGRNKLDEFTWRSETSDIVGKSGAEIILNRTGVMTIRKFGQTVEDKSYHISSAAIPNIFDTLTFSQILDSDYEEVLVEVIEADGTILPLRICRIKTDDSAVEWLFGEETTRKEVVHILKTELLDGRGFYDKVFFDGRRRILKQLLKRETEYVLERTDAETIRKEFPERADYILRKDKLLR